MLTLWRNVRVQRFAFQLGFAAVVVFVGYLLLSNLTSELERTNLVALPFVEFSNSFPFVGKFTLDFLDQRAGFGLSETAFGRSYSANDSYGEAFIAGLLNTISVALIGLVLASLVGLIVGIARLSTNWLVSRLAMAYVEIFRNVPLLVQLIFWYTAVFLRLPRIEDSEIAGIAFASNRGSAIPWLATAEGFTVWLGVLLAGFLLAAGVWAYRSRKEERTGRPSHPWLWASGVLVIIGAVGYLATGAPLRGEVPELENRLLVGGLKFSPEYAALLTGLVLYTGAFITEIVRGSILAIEKGQSEASSALGLSPMQQLRYVILPQAMRIIIPPLTNQYLNLVKNSSLAVAVAFPDVFRVTSVTINQSGQAVPMIVLVMLTYLTLSLIISALMNTVNGRLKVPSR